MLRNMNLHDLASKFQAEAITGSMLLAFTPTELKEELGISLTTAVDADAVEHDPHRYGLLQVVRIQDVRSSKARYDWESRLRKLG